MKRYGNLYAQIYDIENLRVAYENARRGKTKTRPVIQVDKNPNCYLLKIQQILEDECFINSEYNTFELIERGKHRIIHALPFFPDRIIHHAIVQVLGPIWIKTFIRDSYSSIPGRGVHDGVRRIKQIMPSCKGWYALKCDIKKFYPSIDHDTLKAIIKAKIKDPSVLKILDTIIDSEAGVPIGNYLSQYFGNVVLNPFDHWIKEDKGIKYYFRYCDDFVLLHPSKEKLHELRKEITEYLRRLELTVKENWQVFPIEARGVDFMGYRFWPSKTLVRKKTIQRFKERLKTKRMTLNEAVRLRHVIGSFYGWLRYADTGRIINEYVLPAKSRVRSYIRELRQRLSDSAPCQE